MKKLLILLVVLVLAMVLYYVESSPKKEPLNHDGKLKAHHYSKGGKVIY
jgi:uncharacterized protein (UPF0333 family)